jgi:hypothetical protein
MLWNRAGHDTREFADIDRRIELLCSQALHRDAACRLAEISDVLARASRRR